MADDINLTWQPSPSKEAHGYYLYYGKGKGQYIDRIDAGSVTEYTLRLNPGLWHIAASAYSNDPAIKESGLSNEIKVIIPEIVRPVSEIPKTNWQVIYFDSQEIQGEDGHAALAIDGDPKTLWHTQWQSADAPYPHEIRIDLGGWYVIDGFNYLPRQDGESNGTIAGYEFYISGGQDNFGLPVARGEFAPSADLKTVTLNAPIVGRYIRLVATSEINGGPWASIAEIGAHGRLLFQCR